MKIGCELGYKFMRPLVSEPINLGMHGNLPTNTEMLSSFFLVDGVVSSRSAGENDMRSIAPTLSGLLGAKLPDAELPPVSIK